MFADRAEAGRVLARALEEYRVRSPVVVALPRGGVVVGYPVAASLGAPLEVLVVRKIGAPAQPELAIGAAVEVSGAPAEAFISDNAARAGATPEYIAAESARQIEEVRRRQAMYREGRPSIPVCGRLVILVDDGIATGTTIRVGLRAIRRASPARLILAVPVAAARSLDALRGEADEVICLLAPEEFEAVGQFYSDFSQVEDAEVIDLLTRTRAAPGPRAQEGETKGTP